MGRQHSKWRLRRTFGWGRPTPTPQLLGKAAPDFRLKRLRGSELSLAEFKGKVVLLDFWATWCAPCRQEMPDFEKLHRELSGKDVVILAVDVNEGEDIVAEYIDKEKYTFPVLFSEGTDVLERYSVNAYPTLVAIDKSGRIADYRASAPGPNRKTAFGRPSTAHAPAHRRPILDSGSGTSPAAARPDGVPAPVTAEDFLRDGVRLHAGKDLAGGRVRPRSRPAVEPSPGSRV